MSHRESYCNYQTLRDLFPDYGIVVPTTVENFQNNASHTEECPQFSLGECGQFPQHNLLLPDKDLMIETDIVMDWLIEGVWEASTQTDALPRGDER